MLEPVKRELNTLSWADYIVFALVLVVSAAIGIYYGCTGGKQRTTSEFLMANRQMHVLPVTLSLLASFMSAITLLGTPAEVYRFGTEYWLIWVGYLIMIPMAAHIYIPIFFRLQITSVFEYLELRFSKGVRLCGSVAYIVQMVLYMAIVLYAPALALSAVSGLNVWAAVFSVGIVCIFYTTLGGMKAVMWTDSFQITLMFAGLIAVLVQGSIDLHGFSNIWRIMEEGDRAEIFDWDPNPLVRHTTWGLIIGGAFTWLPIYGVNQAQVQRAVAVPKLRQAQIAMWLNLFGLTALLTICGLCGCVVYAQYQDCDPLRAKDISASDQLLPLYVMDRLAHIRGLPGLFTACLFSGALSTLSSGLNSLAATTLQDFVKGLCFKNLSEYRATVASKILAVVYGVVCLALTFVAAQLGGVLQAALALFGMIGGPQLGIYTLGMLCPCANTYGAYAGFFVSLILTFWMGIGAQVYKHSPPLKPISIAGCEYPNVTSLLNGTITTTASTVLDTTTAAPDVTQMPGYVAIYGVSYIWYGAFAVAVAIIVGLVVSFMTGRTDPSTIDNRLICPIFDAFMCYLPESIRKKLRCGVEPYEDTDDLKETIKHSSQADLAGGYTNVAADKSIDEPMTTEPPHIYYESYI